jgi:PleD family two-component response regulator
VASEGAVITFTLSAGVGQWKPGEPTASLLARIDAALYRAKASGRNRVALAGAGVPALPAGAVAG